MLDIELLEVEFEGVVYDTDWPWSFGAGICSGLAFLFWMLAKCNIMRYIMYYAPKGRVINSMCMVTQLVQISTLIGPTLFAIVYLLTLTPMSKFVGHTGCIILWNTSIAYLHFSFVDGCGFAVFRMILMRDTLGACKYRAMRMIYAGEVAIFACAHFLLVSSFNLTGNAFVVNFCHGYTNVMGDILSVYQGFNANDDPQAEIFRISVTIITFCLALIELCAYLAIFLDQYLHNLKIGKRGIITQEMVIKRNRGHAITLRGQILTFSAKLFFPIFTVIIYSAGWQKKVWITGLIWILIDLLLLPIAQYLSSPELKRFVKNSG